MSHLAIVSDDGMIEVYQQETPTDTLLHLPGPNPGTPYTRCGLDAGLFVHRSRPADWAGVWCTACLNATDKENA